MRKIIIPILAVLIAGYLELIPGFSAIADLPVLLVAGGILTALMVWLLLTAEPRT